MTMSATLPSTSRHGNEERRAPHVVVIGGTTRAGSTTERLARRCVEILDGRGATTTMFAATELEFPMYAPERQGRTPAAELFVETVRHCDGLIIASPGYHGGISGLLKNAIDYTEDLKADSRPYLDGRAVGCIVTAAGYQGIDPVADGYLRLEGDGMGGTKVSFDQDGWGSANPWPTTLTTLDDVAPSSLTSTDWLFH